MNFIYLLNYLMYGSSKTSLVYNQLHEQSPLGELYSKLQIQYPSLNQDPSISENIW